MGMKGKIIGATISTVCMLAGAGAAYFKKRKARKAERKDQKKDKSEQENQELEEKTQMCVEAVALDPKNLEIMQMLACEIEKMDMEEDMEGQLAKIIVNADTGETASEWLDRVFSDESKLRFDLKI